MKQSGRKSTGSLAVVSSIKDARPPPPEVLSPPEAEMWRAVTQSKPGDWWDAGTVPLLTEYCRLKTSIDILNEQLAKGETLIAQTGELPSGYKDGVGILDKKQARMAQLAMKMRLTQQARYDKTKAAKDSRGAAAPASVWERPA